MTRRCGPITTGGITCYGKASSQDLIEKIGGRDELGESGGIR